MNELEIISMCMEILRNNIGRKRKEEDSTILDVIMYLYNTTEIDWEEVLWLWEGYLKNGNLEVSEAIELARERIKDAEDIIKTERALLYELHRSCL